MGNEYKKSRPRFKETRFHIDNELLENYAPIIGALGVALYCAIAKHANSKTQECFPSYETLMKQSGIGNRNTLRKYLKELEASSLIQIFHKKERKNYYKLLDCGDSYKHSSKIDTIVSKPQRISNDSESYQIKPISSILPDTLSLRIKSDKEISSSIKKESGTGAGTPLKDGEKIETIDDTRAWLEARGILPKKVVKKDSPNGL